MSKNSLAVNKSYLELPLFKQALIHKSASSDQNNERLEFLGDATLEVVVSEYLFNRFETLDEGKLTQMRASLVNTQSLAEIFQQLDCKDLLQTSKGTNKLDESHKHSIYAGTLEACIGAIFVERGFEESKGFIMELFHLSILLRQTRKEIILSVVLRSMEKLFVHLMQLKKNLSRRLPH